MPRSYSEEFLFDLHRRQDDDLGTQLARACVKAHLPMAHVARALGVTKLAVYHWFRGQTKIRAANRARAEALLRLIKEDLRTGSLPAANLAESKAFINSIMLPVEMTNVRTGS